jgi:hypothetical protein
VPVMYVLFLYLDLTLWPLSVVGLIFKSASPSLGVDPFLLPSENADVVLSVADCGDLRILYVGLFTFK